MCDFILIEGYKCEDYLKIEVCCIEFVYKGLFVLEDLNILVIVVDYVVEEMDFLVFDFDDIVVIVDFIEVCFVLKRLVV